MNQDSARSRTILLIQPPSTLQKLQRLKSRRPELEAPLPFVYLASYLQDAGFRVYVLDLRIDRMAALERSLKELRPLIAGISVMPGSMLRDALEVTHRIKLVSPATRTIWGGTFPSLHYGLCLQAPDLDFVACGDGEWTLRELATVLADNDDTSAWKSVAGLAYVEDGLVQTTAPRAPVDLNARPVGAWEVLDRYIPHYVNPSGLLSVNTARGCPYSCTFCYNTALYRGFNRYRTKSIEASIEEIEYLQKRYVPRTLIFMDDDFLANRKRGLELLETSHRRFPRLRYRIDARVNELTDSAIASRLAALGLQSVFFGVETPSRDVLRRIRKGCVTDEKFAAARTCHRFDIAGTYSFTCGYPGETLQDLCSSVEMARMLRVIHPNSCSQLEIISPVIGTPLYTEMDGRSFVPHDSLEEWSLFSDWKCADGKAWITDGPLYESFQLAFYLGFSARGGHDGNMRLPARLLSRWSRFRLRGSVPPALPEYRLANRVLKTAIWGGGRRRHARGRRRALVPANDVTTPQTVTAMAPGTGGGMDGHPVTWVRGNQ
jgi:radical SAM superfamily enzyme YgiQ (UPF0313 family)